MEQGAGLVRIHLDTHVAIWMAAGEKRRLRPIERHLKRDALFVSPVALLELSFLYEIGRIREPTEEIADVLRAEFGVEADGGDVGDLAAFARPLRWTRDPFDRLIVAHALSRGATLLTADESIREHCASARWDT